MRYLTWLHAGKHRIDIFNKPWGTEKIYHDGELVSRKWSLFGNQHEFCVAEDGRSVTYRIRIRFRPLLGIGFAIYRNGSAVLLD